MAVPWQSILREHLKRSLCRLHRWKNTNNVLGGFWRRGNTTLLIGCEDEQVEHALAQPDVAGLTGVRDRALMELLYSTGMRRGEAARLQQPEIDLVRGTVMIRQGKGRRDRLVPVGARACHWIARYLDEVRPKLVTRPDDWTLFLTDYGEPYENNRLSDLVQRYLRMAGIAHGACHALRVRNTPLAMPRLHGLTHTVANTGQQLIIEDMHWADLMSVLLPILETQHWPDWEKAKRDSASNSDRAPKIRM